MYICFEANLGRISRCHSCDYGCLYSTFWLCIFPLISEGVIDLTCMHRSYVLCPVGLQTYICMNKNRRRTCIYYERWPYILTTNVYLFWGKLGEDKQVPFLWLWLFVFDILTVYFPTNFRRCNSCDYGRYYSTPLLQFYKSVLMSNLFQLLLILKYVNNKRRWQNQNLLKMRWWYYWQTQCSCLWFQWHLCSHMK
jgi:hypothetical protein